MQKCSSLPKYYKESGQLGGRLTGRKCESPPPGGWTSSRGENNPSEHSDLKCVMAL